MNIFWVAIFCHSQLFNQIMAPSPYSCMRLSYNVIINVNNLDVSIILRGENLKLLKSLDLSAIWFRVNYAFRFMWELQIFKSKSCRSRGMLFTLKYHRIIIRILLCMPCVLLGLTQQLYLMLMTELVGAIHSKNLVKYFWMLYRDEGTSKRLAYLYLQRKTRVWNSHSCLKGLKV